MTMSMKVRQFTADYQINLSTLENLKTVIKNIALCQASEINKTAKNEENSEFVLSAVQVANQIISSHWFEALDKTAVEQEIKNLEKSIEVIVSDNGLVKDQGIGKPVPLCYEVLSLIFAQTNEKFRQHYFHELIELYYNELCISLKKISCTYVFKRSKFDIQVKVLLPVVKFEALLKISKDGDSRDQQSVTELVSNILNYFNHPRMNQEDIYYVVRNKIGSDNFDVISYEFIPLDQKNGFLGEYFQLKMYVKHANKHEKLVLFAKFSNPNSFFRPLIELGTAKKEEFFYMVFLPKLKELGLSKLLDFAPNCYFSRVDDVLILDDMTVFGYVGLTPNTKLEYDTLRLAACQIAKLHACSFISEEILSKNEGKQMYLFDLFNEYLQEIWFFRNNKNFGQTFQSNVDIIMYFCSQFPELTSNYSDTELLKKAQKGWELVFEKVARSDKFKNALCHGDMHVSNLLFRFDDNKICQAAILIDFQLLRYCPPTHDLSFFLYHTAFKETLELHINELMDEYYNVLSHSLETFNLDIEKIYSRNDFDESMKYIKSQAIFQSFYYSPLQMMDPKIKEQILQDKNNVKDDMNDKFSIFEIPMKSDAYRSVMKGLVASFIDLCDSGEL